MPSKSHGITFCSYIFTCNCSLQRILVLVWGLWLLLTLSIWALTRLLLCMLLLPCIMEILYLWICKSSPFICSGNLFMRWATLISWFWAWVVAGLVSLLAFPHCHLPGELASSALASSVNVADSKEWSRFFCSHTFRYTSAIFALPRAVLLFIPGKVQGLLSELLHLMRGWASSSVLMSPRSALLRVAGDNKWWGWGQTYFHHRWRLSGYLRSELSPGDMMALGGHAATETCWSGRSSIGPRWPWLRPWSYCNLSLC